MKHSVNELYKISGKGYYTEDYIKEKYFVGAVSKVYYIGARDTAKIKTAKYIKEIYLYGEKTWFDTREERDAYREEANKNHTKMVSKNKVIKLINEKLKGMTEEELNELLQAF